MEKEIKNLKKITKTLEEDLTSKVQALKNQK